MPDDFRRERKDSRRVIDTIGSESFDGALHRVAARSGYSKNAKRDRLDLEPGQEIEVTIEADTRMRSVDIPAELAATLASRPDVAAVFNTLAPSYRRDFADWVVQAKKVATKQTRAERALEMIAAKRHRKALLDRNRAAALGRGTNDTNYRECKTNRYTYRAKVLELDDPHTGPTSQRDKQ